MTATRELAARPGAAVNALTAILERTRARGGGAGEARAAARTSRRRRPSRREPTTARSFATRCARPGLSVIAEHKRRSPSAGVIREDVALEEVVGAYERGGAAALSVLTEDAELRRHRSTISARARAAASLPILRKDFIVDPYQVLEAAGGGRRRDPADRRRAGPRDAGRRCTREALGSGLDALVEVHDARRARRSPRSSAPRIIGINNRDLTTLEVDVGRRSSCCPQVPAGALIVAESGFRGRDELERLAAAGVDAVLDRRGADARRRDRGRLPRADRRRRAVARLNRPCAVTFVR